MANDLFSYPPRLMGRAEAARYMGVSITTFDEMMGEGTFPKPKMIKSKAVWDRVDLDLAASALTEDNRTVTQKLIDHYHGKREADDPKIWDEARKLLTREKGVSWTALAKLLGREKYDPDLIMEKTGLNIERVRGNWFGTPK